MVRSKSNRNVGTFSDAGIVIDESKNLLITKKNGMIKKYIKKDNVFMFSPPEGSSDAGFNLEVNGEKIVGIPENRLRTLKKKKKWLRI